MCGDLEEDDSLEGDLYQRFLLRSRALVARRSAGGDPLHAYLDELFVDLLRRCVDDTTDSAPGDRYRLVSMQSVALARLAGFLAGHGALRDDPLRRLMEAAMLGYGEAEAPLSHHDHDHGHGHDHDHEHGHDHSPGAHGGHDGGAHDDTHDGAHEHGHSHSHASGR